ncbi:hypothetical protein MKX01_020320 [Papaver californicum]|nr:hypothetical protein MKX01_020320 [Papaver californicum]
MSLSQLQLNNLSAAKDVGKAFGVLAGIASDRLTTHVILFIGLWKMCIFLALGGNSTTWMNTAILVTNRGPVFGIFKGFVGLSTTIFTDVSSALFANSPSKFLFMLAIVPAVVCLTTIFFLREVPRTITNTAAQQEEKSKYENFFNIVAVIVALYLLTYDLSGKHSHLLSLPFAFGLLFPLVNSNSDNNDVDTSVHHQHNGDQVQEEETQTVETKMGEKSILVVEEKDSENDQVVEMEYKKPTLGEDHTILEVVKTLDFWILFLSFLCGVGTGLAVMNNLGQMGLDLRHVDVSIFVSLTSIFGFFAVSAPEQYLNTFSSTNHATPRPLWNAASQIPMSLGYVVLAILLPGSLYAVPTASELFGLKYYGLIYNILILNLPLGSFLFSDLLAGFLYDAQANKTEGGGNTCVGAHCYRQDFVIMALSCVVGFGLDVLLVFRTKNLYKKIQIGKKSSQENQVYIRKNNTGD